MPKAGAAPRRDQLGPKMEYQTWANQIRAPLLQIRSVYGIGWNQLSKRLGKSNQGWAQAAVRHRSVCSPRDIWLIDNLIQHLAAAATEPPEEVFSLPTPPASTPPPAETKEEDRPMPATAAATGQRKTYVPKTPLLNEREQKEVRETIDWLRTGHEAYPHFSPPYSMSDISRLLGLRETTIAGVRNRDHGRCSPEIKRQLEAIKAQVERGERPEPPKYAKNQRSPTHPRRRTQYMHLSTHDPEVPQVPVELPKPPALTLPPTTVVNLNFRATVRDGLFQLAEIVLNAIPRGLPPAYRAPYEADAERLMDVAKTFQDDEAA